MWQESVDKAQTSTQWSNVGHAIIKSLQLQGAAERGISWDTYTDTVLNSQEDWILQTPPSKIWKVGDGYDDSMKLLHQKLRCSGSTDRGKVDVVCYPDFKLWQCNPEDLGGGCLNGGTCQPFASTVTKPGMKPVHLCAGPADAILDRFYDVIVKAKKYVDIASLEMPDGRFLAAIRNGITYLQNARLQDPSLGVIQVRFLFGHMLGESLLDLPIPALAAISNVGSKTTLEILLRDILPDFSSFVHNKSQTIRVVAGTLRWWPDSWNHAKIVAADGERLIQGGINFWTRDYLDHDPVFDISMELSGSVAVGAHRFVDSLWNSICTGIANKRDVGFAGGFSYFPYSVSKPIKTFARSKQKRKDWEVLPSQAMSTWESFQASDMSWFTTNSSTRPNFSSIAVGRMGSSGSNSVTTNSNDRPKVSSIAVGRMGTLGSNSADVAFVTLLESAKESIKISAQDFGPALSLIGWQYDYIDAICNAMVNGAEVQVMLSKPDFVPAKTSKWQTYIRVGTSIMKSTYDTRGVTELKNVMHAYGMGYTKADVRKQFELRLAHINADPRTINKLHMYYLLEGVVEEGWGNHAKFIMVDDKVFAIGSQNLYACNLQEFNVIVDDADAAKHVLESYWWPLWSRSEVQSVDSGAGAKKPGARRSFSSDKTGISSDSRHALCQEGYVLHRTSGNNCEMHHKDSMGLGCGADAEEFCYKTDPTARCCCKAGGVVLVKSHIMKYKTATSWC